MNKNKKIAMAVIATVMAGVMVVPLAGCKKKPKDEAVELEKWDVFDADGNLNYDAYIRDKEVTLNIAIGHNSATTSTAFDKGSTYTLPDGVTYEGGKMKPAWVQMGKDLNITWNDVYAGKTTGANLEAITSDQSKASYAGTDMFTTDLSEAVSYATAGTADILNLGDYLDYMPNFKNFLEANPIVYLSLLQDGMSTEDGSGKVLYIAPYFDGNDDIERYCIIRQDWASKLLDGATITGGEKYKDECRKKETDEKGNIKPGEGTPVIEPFMKGLDTLKVDVTKPEQDANGEYTLDGVVYKNYKNVKDQIGKSGTPLYVAYHDIVGASAADYTGEGNIVAIMNAAIEADKSVTGSKLVALLRAYIDACYTKTDALGAEKYYTNRADLFNGYDAAWDVDDLVAILRCVMTNQANLLSSESKVDKIFGIAPRSGQNDRTPDMVRLACQLYGVRGGESRYEYTYIDNAGALQDARNDQAFYQACDNLNKLVQEGLVANYTGYKSFDDRMAYPSVKDNTSKAETFMMYDYCQTQTAAGFYNEGATGVDVPAAFNFAPILTPVSKWDVNGNGSIGSDEYFRFTESWRSTKTSGLALNGALATDKDKLKAALQFVDYLYSKDGQIISTYGPMADADGNGGFWYNAAATEAEKTAGQYFTYKGVKYSGYLYKGSYHPTITEKLYNSFIGADTITDIPSTVSGAVLSFTNYARYLIGSTLPIGVKDQAFEDQLTSSCGKEGSAKVAAALANEIGDTGYTVIRGMSLNINESKWWYTCVPTSLPVPAINKPILDDSTMNSLKYMSGEAKDKKSNEKNFLSIFNHIILNGTGTAFDQQGESYTFTTLGALTTAMSATYRAQDREDNVAKGWNQAKDYWTYLKPNK